MFDNEPALIASGAANKSIYASNYYRRAALITRMLKLYLAMHIS